MNPTPFGESFAIDEEHLNTHSGTSNRFVFFLVFVIGSINFLQQMQMHTNQLKMTAFFLPGI